MQSPKIDASLEEAFGKSGVAQLEAYYKLLRDAVNYSKSEKSIRELGDKILDAVKKDYWRKSMGYRDSNGNSWRRTKKGRPIMIDTGLLLSSIDVSVKGSEITISVDDNVVPYAKYALGVRPAWPKDDTLPDSWKKIVDEHIKSKIDEFLRKAASR